MIKGITTIATLLICGQVHAEQINEYFSCEPFRVKSYNVGGTGSTDFDIDCTTNRHIHECSTFRIDKNNLSANGGSYIYQYEEDKSKDKIAISRTTGDYHQSGTYFGAYETRTSGNGTCTLKKEKLKY